VVIVDAGASAYLDQTGEFRQSSGSGDFARTDARGHFEFPPKGSETCSETSTSEIPIQINKETQTTSEIDHQSFREQATKNFLFSQI